MRHDTGPESEIRDTLAEASRLAEERDAAASEQSLAAGGGGRRLIAAGLALLVVAGWDAYALTRPPEPLPAGELEGDLRLMVATTVEDIEDARAELGRLPTPEEIADALDAGMSYVVAGSAYSVTAADDGVSVRFDGTVPLAAWLTRGTSAEPVPGAAR